MQDRPGESAPVCAENKAAWVSVGHFTCLRKRRVGGRKGGRGRAREMGDRGQNLRFMRKN